MFFNIKYHLFISYLSLFFILIGCQIQEPSKHHGIIFLENRSNKITINKSNTNDVISIFGQPHSKSLKNENQWIYFERVMTKGKYHQLGKNILETNNVLVLEFNKFGILVNKAFLKKEDKKRLKFSTDKTENDLSQKSFVQKFLQSIKSKMYGNR